MKSDTPSSVFLTALKKYWLPALSFLVLAFFCLDSHIVGSRDNAQLLSGDFYKGFILVSFGLLVAAAFARAWRPLRMGLELIACSLVITNLFVKYAIPLGRPLRVSHGQTLPGYSPGFPSAHTAFAFGLAWLCFRLEPRLAPLWFGIAIAVGWSRVELRAHYPYQVLVGALLGMALGWWISRSAPSIFRRPPFHRTSASLESSSSQPQKSTQNSSGAP